MCHFKLHFGADITTSEGQTDILIIVLLSVAAVILGTVFKWLIM